MTIGDKKQATRNDDGAAFPVEAKVAIGVIAAGVVVLIVKAFGVF